MVAKWTIMVYMAGNNSLSDAAGADLSEMESVGSTDTVNVLAFVKQKSPKSAFHVEIGKGSSKKTNIGDVDSGSPQTAVDFVRWAVNQAPAERYALVVWNHGGGWEPDDLQELYASVRGSNGQDRELRELSVRSNQLLARSLFSPTLREVLNQPTHADRAVASDDGTLHSLDTIELGRVVEKVATEVGRPLDLLGMDACLMSGLDVAYQAHDSAGILVGSEELEPGTGWPYEQILKGLNKSPDMTGKELGDLVVKSYISSYRDDQRVWPVTQCAVSTQTMDRFARALDAFEQALRPQLSKVFASVTGALSRSACFDFHLTDLKSLCRNIVASKLDSNVKEAANAIVDALEPGGLVVAEGHLGPKVADCGGLTIYFPSPPAGISKYYKDLRFAKEHRWDEFLREYQQAVRAG